MSRVLSIASVGLLAMLAGVVTATSAAASYSDPADGTGAVGLSAATGSATPVWLLVATAVAVAGAAFLVGMRVGRRHPTTPVVGVAVG